MANGFGLSLTVVFLLFLIPNIFLAGYDYKETYIRWLKSPYKSIGPLQIASVCGGFVSAILSLLTFGTNNKSLVGIVRIIYIFYIKDYSF
jgi:hypothetical protein